MADTATPFEIDLYWSFRSPYSYLATGRLVGLERDFDLAVRVRPVLPIAVRDPDFFATVNPLWPPYLIRDVSRTADYLGIPIAWPRPDPVLQLPRDGRLVTAPEQPHAHRLTRLGVAAAEAGHGLAFLDEVSRLLWSGEVDGWHEGSHLADATARAGLDLATLEATIAKETPRFDAAIEAHQRDLEAAGHWGVPTCVFRGEVFFGQDRLDLLLWRMRQQGLRERRADAARDRGADAAGDRGAGASR